MALSASGTATLECALLEIPLVLFYRVSPVTLFLTRVCQKVGLLQDYWIGLPNLLAGRVIHPEIHQNEVTPQNLAAAPYRLLRDPAACHAMQHEFRRIAAQLGNGRSLHQICREVLQKLPQ